MFLARDEGWLGSADIELQSTSDASHSLDLLRNGAVDGAALTLDEVLRARDAGIPLTVVLVFDVSAGADKVIARHPLARLSDLRGQRIGVELTAVGALVLRQLLQAADLQQDEVTIVPTPASERQRWDAGEIDVMITYEPLAATLLKEGATTIFDSRQMPDMIFDVLAVRSDVLDRQQAAIRTLVAGHFRGLRELRANPGDIRYRLARYLDLPGEQVSGSFAGLQLPEMTVNRSYLAPAGGRIVETARLLNGLMLQSGTLSRTDDLTGLVTPACLPDSA